MAPSEPGTTRTESRMAAERGAAVCRGAACCAPTPSGSVVPLRITIPWTWLGITMKASKVFTVPHTDGNEIRAGPGVIEPRQPERSPPVGDSKRHPFDAHGSTLRKVVPGGASSCRARNPFRSGRNESLGGGVGRKSPTLGLPCQVIALDLLVEVAARHVQCARRLRHVAVVLLQLREQIGALGGLLELFERGRAHPRCSGVILAASL